MDEQKKKEMARDLSGLLIYAAGICLVVFLILHFVGQRTIVCGDSMEPTLTNGESLILDKLSYRFSDPERYDIVVFPGLLQFDEQPYYIKRVIGLPGETLQIKEGKVYIDGQCLETETYGIDVIEDPGIAVDPVTLGQEEYFLMGDNRPVSLDSRREELGPVSRNEIVGKVSIRILPWSKAGKIDR